MNETHVPTTYHGVSVPQIFHPGEAVHHGSNWVQVEAYWWRRGVDMALDLPEAGR